MNFINTKVYDTFLCSYQNSSAISQKLLPSCGIKTNLAQQVLTQRDLIARLLLKVYIPHTHNLLVYVQANDKLYSFVAFKGSEVFKTLSSIPLNSLVMLSFQRKQNKTYCENCQKVKIKEFI